MNNCNTRISRFDRAGRAPKGFSLIEIIIVLAIIGLLASVVIARFTGVLGTAQEDTAKTFVTQSLKVPLTQYRIHMGRYPTTEEGLQALVSAPANAGNKWRGPYVEEIPEDPWGNQYQYKFPGTKNADAYDLYSYGPNTQEGGGDDIGNWKAAE